MFTAVLMVSMSTTPMTAEFGRRRGGCCGGSDSGCYGSCHGGRRAWRGRGGCSGGYGGCSGGGYGGCSGGYGGCTGGGYGGCTGGYYMPPIREEREKFIPGGGKKRTSSADDNDLQGTGSNDSALDEQAKAPTAATVVVQLPADALLTIDGKPTRSTTAQRTFASPPLPRGQNFYYTFKATVVRDGRPIATEERVRVRAGEITRLSMSLPAASVTRK